MSLSFDMILVEQRKYNAHYVFVNLWRMKETKAKMINLPKLKNFRLKYSVDPRFRTKISI